MLFGRKDVIVEGLVRDLKGSRDEVDSLRVSAGFAEEVVAQYSDYLGPVLGHDLGVLPTHKLLSGIDRAFRERRYLERKLDAVLAALNTAEHSHTRLQYARSIIESAQAYLDDDQPIPLPYEWERS